jgi:hypothetical protein
MINQSQSPFIWVAGDPRGSRSKIVIGVKVNLVPRVCLFAGYVVYITREQASSGNEIGSRSKKNIFVSEA